jgi:hypothetical protein
VGRSAVGVWHRVVDVAADGRRLTKSASAAEGVYRGSATDGKLNGRNVADFASSATTCGGINSSAPAMKPGVEPVPSEVD